MMRLGLRDGIGHGPSDFLKVVLAGLQIADDDLELGQAVEQGRQAALLFARQVAEALDQVLHHLALGITAERKAVARPHRAGVQVMATFEICDSVIEILKRLALLVLFRLKV
jgi:hypothetical protein